MAYFPEEFRKVAEEAGAVKRRGEREEGRGMPVVRGSGLMRKALERISPSRKLSGAPQVLMK
jgi:hypothetical protein